MNHPLHRFASSPSLAFGGRGTAPAARRSRFRGATGQLPFAPNSVSMKRAKENPYVCRVRMQ